MNTVLPSPAFLKVILSVLLSLTVSMGSTLAGPVTWQPSSSIGYVRKSVPQVRVPQLIGERYQVLVPNTFDLGNRALYAIHAMTSEADPEADYETYFRVIVTEKPPRMVHDFDDFQGCGPKFLEALALLRTMTGSTYNQDVDERQLNVYLHMIGPDGVWYAPLKGRPWGLDGTHLGPDSPAGESRQLASVYGNGRAMLALVAWNKRLQNPVINGLLNRMVSGLAEHTVDHGDYCYFPAKFFGLGEQPDPQAPPMNTDVNGVKHVDPCVSVIHGLVQHYRATGYKPALRLAGKLVNFLRYHSGQYDGAGHFTGHFHGHAYGLLAMLDYALAKGDKDLAEYARSGFEFIRTLGCPDTGFYPEYHPKAPQARSQMTCETCCLADFLALATELSTAGLGDYWDDVESCVRNQFAENQMLETDWLHALNPPPKESPIGKWTSTVDVLRRNVGCFAGWASGNDLFPYPVEGIGPTCFTHCCTGNGARAIYYVWEHIATFTNGTFSVNLLLNRASRIADIDSDLPYRGMVEIRVKKDCKLQIRIPRWAPLESVMCATNNVQVKHGWAGRYVVLGQIAAGTKVSVNFPVLERTEQVVMGGPMYSVRLRGSTVMHIKPKGKVYPFYCHREEHQSLQWKLTEYFVPQTTILW